MSTAHSIAPRLEVLERGGVSAGVACGKALELGTGHGLGGCVFSHTHTPYTHTPHTGSCPRIEAAQKLLPGFFVFPSSELSYLRPFQLRNSSQQ